MFIGKRRRPDVNRLDLIEGNAAALIDPVSGRRRLVIKGILRLAPNVADERERRLVIAARRIAKFDLRGQRMVGYDAAEQISRDAAHKARRCAQTRDADGDVETGSPSHRYGRVAAVHGFDGQEIDQGISTTQQHGSNFLHQLQRSR